MNEHELRNRRRAAVMEYLRVMSGGRGYERMTPEEYIHNERVARAEVDKWTAELKRYLHSKKGDER